jgi:hypothetical protein
LTEPLEYRDGHEPGDVDPVHIEHVGEKLRIVVRYPRADRLRARNRFLFTAAIAIAYMVLSWQAVMRIPNRLGYGAILVSLWPIGVFTAGIMATLWYRSGWLYVLEIDGASVCIESRSSWRVYKHHIERPFILDIRVENSRPPALRFIGRKKHAGGQIFLGLDKKHLVLIADALREKLGMTETAK